VSKEDSGPDDRSDDTGVDKKALVSRAQAYIEKRHPDWPSPETEPVVQEKSGTWIITWPVPEGQLGGAPHVVIDKNSDEVVEAYHTQ
jgi:hypothetical protein